jgi:hypothetical protein
MLSDWCSVCKRLQVFYRLVDAVLIITSGHVPLDRRLSFHWSPDDDPNSQCFDRVAMIPPIPEIGTKEATARWDVCMSVSLRLLIPIGCITYKHGYISKPTINGARARWPQPLILERSEELTES